MSPVRHLLAALAAGVLFAAGLVLLPVRNDETPPPALTRPQAEAVERIIRDYLLANPELILEAVGGLERRRDSQAEAKARAELAARRSEIFEDPDSPVAGNPSGDVTIVEFFDYRCPYCKQVAGPLMRLIADDPQLRLVFKELPILGPDSVVAARAALGARAQRRYLPMHMALMRSRGPLDEMVVLAIAAEAGLDVARLEADMAAPEITRIIDRTRSLARALGINGTPAFVIGDRLIPGAVDLDTLKKLVAEARQR
ncbi:MAG: DsbA family protein [Pseudomonadota bacterium]